MSGLFSLDVVNTAVGVGGLAVAVGGILVARRPTAGAFPPEMSTEARRRVIIDSSFAGLPPEIEERIFLAEETSTVEDDIEALEAAIAFLEGQLAEATGAEKRMPIRRQLRHLRSEIEQLRRGRGSAIGTLAALLDPLWLLLYRLHPLRRRTRPWLAAVVGFALGGIGLIVYFRTLVDIAMLAGLVIAVVVAEMFLGTGSWWIGVTIASLYGFVRSLSSNRRLALGTSEQAALQTASGAVPGYDVVK